MLDDLVTLAAISGLIIFSIGLTILMHRRKPAVVVREGAADDLLPGASGGSHVGTAAEQAITVTFSKSNTNHPWDPEADSLLAFVESRGIDVESQCRAGECGSCRTKIIEGEVVYRQQPSVNPGRGHCLLCVSVPKSDLTLVR